MQIFKKIRKYNKSCIVVYIYIIKNKQKITNIHKSTPNSNNNKFNTNYSTSSNSSNSQISFKVTGDNYEKYQILMA